jgi:hypothetical protein
MAWHRVRGAQGGNQHPSYWLNAIQRGLQESQFMRLQRRQTRFEELPASELCSLSLEDALCATHLLSFPNKANDDQPEPKRPIAGQQKVLSDRSPSMGGVKGQATSGANREGEGTDTQGRDGAAP